MLKVTGIVNELGLVMEMTEPGETAKIATKEYQVHGEGAQVGERHQDEPQGALSTSRRWRMESPWRQEQVSRPSKLGRMME